VCSFSIFLRTTATQPPPFCALFSPYSPEFSDPEPPHIKFKNLYDRIAPERFGFVTMRPSRRSIHMDTAVLTRERLREILRASEGIPSQVSQARIQGGKVIAARVGHPLSSHLHSVAITESKTKFLSFHDQVEALWLFVRVPGVALALKNMKIGDRISPQETVDRLFGIEAELPDPQGRPTRVKVKFTPEEQRNAGRMRTLCVGVLELRERAGQSHLQVHTFYPALSEAEGVVLLESTRNQPT
jgi:hypothetical protein